jgi:hypothetical protein
LINYNVIRGCGGNGIVPGPYPFYNDSLDASVYYSAIYSYQAYDNIDHNIIEYCGSNGIDYWYSDYSVITCNRCNDNGQSGDILHLVDRDGIDCCDHSKDTIVSYNECTNKSSQKTDTVSSIGSSYITALNLDRWYDTRNGKNVPFEGMKVSIGSTENRIESIDLSSGMIYLSFNTSYVSVGDTIKGINSQTIGINITDNGQSLGGHKGTHNNVYGNLLKQIGYIDYRSLPDTYIKSDGTGPQPPLD